MVGACSSPATSVDGSIAGVVTLGGMPAGNGGTVVSIATSGASAVTDDNGVYLIEHVPPGTWLLSASHAGYQSRTESVDVFIAKTTPADAIDLPALAAQGIGVVNGHAFRFDQANASGIAVTLVGSGLVTITGADGAYSFNGVPAGTYQAALALAGFVSVTVDDVVVSDNTFTVRDVTLYKAATVAQGNGAQLLARSPDGAKVLAALDGVLYVVPQGAGAPIAVSGGTFANAGSFSPDGSALALSNVDTLWLVPADGSKPAAYASGVWNHEVHWSSNGARASFGVPNASSGYDWYSFDLATGTPTKVITQGGALLDSPDGQQRLFTVQSTNTMSLGLRDLVMLDFQTGASVKLITGVHDFELATAIADSRDGKAVVMPNVTGKTGLSMAIDVGDLYVFRFGTQAAVKVSTTPIQSDVGIVRTGSDTHFTLSSKNVPGTSNVATSVSIYGGDVEPPVLRTLVANLPPTGTPTLVSGTRTYAIDMKTAITRDLYALDLVNGSGQLVQATVTQPALTAASNNAGDYLRVLDATHVLFATNTTNPGGPAKANLGIFDGTAAHPVATATQTEGAIAGNAFANLQLSASGAICAYAGPVLTDATVATGVTKNLTVQPLLFSLATDGTLIAYAIANTTNDDVKTVTADGLTAVSVGSDPTLIASGGTVAWIYLTPQKDLVLFGDPGVASTPHAFRAPAAGGTVTALGTFTVADVRTDVLAIGARTVIYDPGRFQTFTVDAAPVAAATPVATASSAKPAFANRPHTRAFAFGDNGASTSRVWAIAPTGAALASASSALAFDVPGMLPQPLVSPSGRVVYFAGANGVATDPLIAFGETGAEVVLANAQDSTKGPFGNGNYVLDDSGKNLMWVDGSTIKASALDQPVANVVATGYAGFDIGPGLSSNVSPFSPWVSPDRSTLYALSANGAAFTCKAFAFATGTLGTLGADVAFVQRTVTLPSPPFPPGSMVTVTDSPSFSADTRSLFFQTAPDNLKGTFTLDVVPVGGTTPVKLADSVSAFAESPTGRAVAGTTSVSGVTQLFSGPVTSTAPLGTLDVVEGQGATFSWAIDETRVYAIFPSSGRAWVQLVGASGAQGANVALVDIGVSALLADFNGTRAVLIAQHPGDPIATLERLDSPL